MATILLYGDTIRYPAMRHEVPIEVLDPFLFVDRDGQTLVMTSSLEAPRIAKVLPGAELITSDELGLFELLEEGMSDDEADREVGAPSAPKLGHRARGRGRRPPRGGRGSPARRRHRHRCRRGRREGSPPRQDAGGAGRHPPSAARRRGRHGRCRAADPGRRSGPAGSCITTANRSPPRGSVRRSARSAPRPALRPPRTSRSPRLCPDVVTTQARGRCPSDLPINIDVWPHDEESGCWADMARTFVAGEVTSEVAELRDVVLRGARGGPVRRAPGSQRPRSLRHRGGDHRASGPSHPADPHARRDPHPRLLLQPGARSGARGARAAVPRPRRA